MPTNDKEIDKDRKIKETEALVNALFQDVNDNQDVPEVIRKLLYKLSDRFMAIALDTPNLFVFENHQARIFLQTAIQTSIDWNQEEDANNSYHKNVKSIIEKINDLETYDSKIFIKFSKELEKSLVRIKKRASIKKKRLQEKLQGEEKIKQANKITTQLLSSLGNKKKLPAFIDKIIKNEWSNVLVLMHIRHSEESTEFQLHLNFIKSLIDALQLGKDKKLTNTKLKSLSAGYKKGLQLVAFHQQEIEVKQKQLLQFLIKLNQTQSKAKQVIKPKEVKIAKKPVQKAAIKQDKIKPIVFVHTPKSTQAKTPVKAQVKRIPIEKKKKINFLEIVSQMKIGTWVEFKQINNKVIKAKLSWISPITGKFLFVDAQGVKLTDRTNQELIDELEKRTIRIVNKKP